MKTILNKRKKIFANKLHQQTVLLIFLAILLPVLVTIFCLYYLIFNITATQFMLPEIIIHDIIPAAKKVTLILLVSLPIVISLTLFIAYKITHLIFGPFDRIDKDLEHRIKNKSNQPILIRKNDKFKPLVDKINRLLTRQDTN
jgi:ABC-type multidrug transport system fused ATPase/permease subunit